MLRRMDVRIPDSLEEPAIGLADVLRVSWFCNPRICPAGQGEEAFARAGDSTMSFLYSPVEQDAEKIEQTVRSWAADFGVPATALETSDYEENPDWMKTFREHFQPISLGQDLLICAPWSEMAAPSAEHHHGHRHRLLIDPGMAFGTGTHETTRLCLQLLVELLADQSPDPLANLPGNLSGNLSGNLPVENLEFLDLGAGSGILSFYLMKRGAAAGIAIEIEGAAVENLRKNAKLNDMPPTLEIRCQDLFDLGFPPRFGLILANLSSPVLHAALPVFTPWVKPGGIGVFSGIGLANLAGIREAFGLAGWEIQHELEEGEWHAFRAVRR